MTLFAPEHFAGDRGPLYLQLKTRIADAIVDGQLRAGESLPPERELAALTGLSRVTVRKAVRSLWLSRAVHAPSPEEMMALGLTAHDRVARLERVRLADGVPLAIERAALSTAMLPDPGAVGASLYAALSERGLRPVRAVQRISAANLGARDAELLEVPVGAAGLRIERISYLRSGRAVEFTRSLYRGDAYDFAAELQIPADEQGRTT